MARAAHAIRQLQARRAEAESAEDVRPSMPTRPASPTSKIKTRVGRAAVVHGVFSILLFIFAVVCQRQYSWSVRFSGTGVGASLIAILFLKAVTDGILSVYGCVLWWLHKVLDFKWFSPWAGLSLLDLIFALWALGVSINSMAIDSSTYVSSSMKTLLVVVGLVLLIVCAGSVIFVLSVVLFWRRETRRLANASGVALEHVHVSTSDHDDDGHHGARHASDDDHEDDDDEDEEEEEPADDSEHPPVVKARPVPAPVARLASGPGAAPPATNLYMPVSTPGRQEPVHDESTRNMFSHMWQSFSEMGSFACVVSVVPTLPQLIAHLRLQGFHTLFQGVTEADERLYFYAEAPGSPGSMVFVAEFVFHLSTKTLTATFKAVDATHMGFVKNFHLDVLFDVVQAL